jgi:hypothetical protein
MKIRNAELKDVQGIAKVHVDNSKRRYINGKYHISK